MRQRLVSSMLVLCAMPD